MGLTAAPTHNSLADENSSAQAELPQPDPAGTSPSEPAQTELAQTELAQTELAQTEPVQTAPVQPEPALAESVQEGHNAGTAALGASDSADLADIGLSSPGASDSDAGNDWVNYGVNDGDNDSAGEDSPASQKRWFSRLVTSPGALLRAILMVAGGLGIVFSLILAAGALCVALGVDLGTGMGSRFEWVCNGLSRPLHSAFSFTGDNAAQKRDLVVWGVASLGYLIVGTFLQSLGRRRWGGTHRM